TYRQSMQDWRHPSPRARRSTRRTSTGPWCAVAVQPSFTSWRKAATASPRSHAAAQVRKHANTSDAAAVASDFGLRDLRRNQISPECVAPKGPGNAHADRPTRQINDLDVHLLTGSHGDIRVLLGCRAGVVRPAFRHDVISPGRNVAVEHAAVFDGPKIDAVYIDISQIEALRGQPDAVDPDPTLARRNRRLGYWGSRGASRRNQ